MEILEGVSQRTKIVNKSMTGMLNGPSKAMDFTKLLLKFHRSCRGVSRKHRPRKRRPQTTDLENADLENTDLENTDLQNADLQNADLENTDHENADLENTDLANKDLENTDVSQTACARERIMAAMKSLSSSFFFPLVSNYRDIEKSIMEGVIGPK